MRVHSSFRPFLLVRASLVLALILAGGTARASENIPVFQDNLHQAGKQKRRDGRTAATAPGKGGRGGQGVRGGGNRTFKQPWISECYRRVVSESRKRERILVRTRDRLNRDLTMLVRAQVFLTRKNRAKQPAGSNRSNTVLDRIRCIREKVLHASRSSKTDLRKTMANTRQTFRKLEDGLGNVHRNRRSPQGSNHRGAQFTAAGSGGRPEVDRRSTAMRGRLRSQIEAEVEKTLTRMKQINQNFNRMIAPHRKAVSLLARMTREQLKKGSYSRKKKVPSGSLSRSSLRLANARQAYAHLKKMKADRRRELLKRQKKDARRIRELNLKISRLEKQVKAAREEIRQLRMKRKKDKEKKKAREQA